MKPKLRSDFGIVFPFRTNNEIMEKVRQFLHFLSQSQEFAYYYQLIQHNIDTSDIQMNPQASQHTRRKQKLFIPPLQLQKRHEDLFRETPVVLQPPLKLFFD